MTPGLRGGARGDLGEAEADAREALAPAASLGASARFAGHASAFLADTLMEQGRVAEAAAVLAAPGLGAALPHSARMLYLRDNNARLRILRGDGGGLAELLDAGRGFEAVGSHNPAFIAWRSQAALVLRQQGELDETRRLAEGPDVTHRPARRRRQPPTLGALSGLCSAALAW